nr:hypothetical protein [Solimonas terrae]
MCLPEGAGEAAEQGDGDERGRGHGEAVPSPELAHPVAERVGPGEHGLVVEMAPQIVGKCIDRRIATSRCFLQGLADDGVEVAFQCFPQLSRQAAARAGDGAGLRQDPAAFADAPVAHRRHFGIEYLPLDLRIGLSGIAVGASAAEQPVQQHAERVDIGDDGDRGTAHLLGCGVLRRHRPAAEARQFGLGPGAGFVLDEFGNAEVEQLRLAVRCHENVRRFDVAMHDQVCMRMADGGADLQEQGDARRQIELPGVAPAIDAIALDILDCQIELAARQDAGIEQTRDVAMRELAEDAAFPQKAFACRRLPEVQVQQFQRNRGLEQAVGASCEPDFAHAAFAQSPFYAIGAERAADLNLLPLGIALVLIEKGRPFGLFVGAQQCVHLHPQTRVLRTKFFDCLFALGAFQTEQALERREGGAPAGHIVRLVHGLSSASI